MKFDLKHTFDVPVDQVLAGLADPATLNGFRTAPLISSRRWCRFRWRAPRREVKGLGLLAGLTGGLWSEWQSRGRR